MSVIICLFLLLEMKKKFKGGTNTQTSHLVRIKPPEAIMALKADLRNQDWKEVYGDDTNQSYDAFIDTFLVFMTSISH